VNQHFEDAIETPGYREWEAFELRSLLSRHGFHPQRDGLWENQQKGYSLVVSPTGLFVGWLDLYGGLPGPKTWRLMNVQHIPRGFENRLLEEVIEGMEKARKAASIQCRHCGEVFTPGGIVYERTCLECATEVDGIVF